MATRPVLQIRKFAVAFLLASMLSLVIHGGEVPQSGRQFTVRTWELGQRMFYSDLYWRGGDCASSLDLGDGRVLWLFADSYIAVKPPYYRDSCCVTMIRNCMGIQKGYDPSAADFSVFYRGTKEDPSAFFSCDDTSWFWPGNAVRIDSFLVVFLMHVCSSSSGLSFRACGGSPHAAFLVSDFDGNPLGWTLTQLSLPENPFGIMLGAATIVEPPYLYIFNVKEPGDHSMYLARWHIDSILNGSTCAIEWWTGDSSVWVRDSELDSQPAAIFADGATELSVIHDTRADGYLAIQTVGFGAADVMLRTAPALYGPWSELQIVYEPPEKSESDVMIYAAKAHPEITGADIVITYNTNGPTEKIIEDTTIYYPRFVRMYWSQ